VKDIFASQEAKRDFRLAWFSESDDNVVDYLLSKDHLTYDEVQKRILNLPSYHHSPSKAFSKNSKPLHEAHLISLSSRPKDKKKKKGSGSSSNPGSKRYNWCRKHSPAPASSQIWTSYNERNVQRDTNGAEMAAPIQEVANT
jgi:hypothetical protein